MQTLTQLADAVEEALATGDHQQQTDAIAALIAAVRATEQSGETVASAVFQMQDMWNQLERVEQLQPVFVTPRDMQRWSYALSVIEQLHTRPQPAPAVPVSNEAISDLLCAIQHYGSCKWSEGRGTIKDPTLVDVRSAWDSVYASVQSLYAQPAPAVPDAVELLREMEWENNRFADACPVCTARREKGHAADCKLAAVLTAQQPAPAVSDAVIEELRHAFANAARWGGHEACHRVDVRALLAAAPQPAQQMPTVIEEIAAERRRQIEVEGWTPEHDDEHEPRMLAAAGACYALHWLTEGNRPLLAIWPWDESWWKPSADPRRNWIKAAALLVAEIEREDRASRKGGGDAD
ncbi:Uncharacterized protein ChrSV_2326 [Chromobacterium vaccinii]|nr:Uncharacterized protein ChrSW_2326 [Chromobacterium vaccinii]QND89783.1 Uncharacterized protein ChrSV_2326 [Chromobacterium vaccinii]